MANLFMRLVLTNGEVFQAGDTWTDPRRGPQPATVGLIFLVPESTRSFVEGGGEEPPEVPGEPVEEDPGDEIVEVTPSYYEVWAYPIKDGEWARGNETICRKVPASSVLYAEEVWTLAAAMQVIRSRMSEIEGVEEQPPPPVAQPVPVQAPPQQQPVPQAVPQPEPTS